MNKNNIDKQNPIVIIETSKGNILVELDQAHAPITVNNFLSYVNSGFYDNTVFHRVIDNFMIQGGGFNLNHQQKNTNAPIKLESNNGLTNSIGTLAMARTNVPDSATSQFFINVADNGFLNYNPQNPGYAVFGKVIEGMGIVNSIKSVETTADSKTGMDDWPVEEIVIKRIYLKNN